VVRPTEVRLDCSRAAALLCTRLRGVRELLAAPPDR
jgi:dTDP-4-dehydrorhamnose reductase